MPFQLYQIETFAPALSWFLFIETTINIPTVFLRFSTSLVLSCDHSVNERIFRSCVPLNPIKSYKFAYVEQQIVIKNP